MQSLEKIIVVSSQQELEVIQKKYPESKGAHVVLISPDFNWSISESLRQNKYFYFDKDIDSEIADRIGEATNKVLWQWFVDSKGNDLSVIDGCSLGVAFINTMEFLLTTLLRYELAFAKFLRKDTSIYYVSTIDDRFKIVIRYLQAKIGFDIFSCMSDKTKYAFGARKPILDKYFNQVSWRKRVLSYLVDRRKLKPGTNKRILVVSAGKLDEYFEHIKVTGGLKGLTFILPASRKDLKTILFSNRHKNLFYHFHSYSKKDKKILKEINEIILSLKKNIKENVKDINSDMLLAAMQEYIFDNFYGAYCFYSNVLMSFNSLKPEVVLLCADGHEIHVLIAQAAKRFDCTTAYVPHGLTDFGYRQHKSDEYKIFDYFLALGKKDILDYKAQGAKDQAIRISSFPYFARFLPLADKRTKKGYKKALILPLDYHTGSPGAKIGSSFDFIVGAVGVLAGLGVDVAGVKARCKESLWNFGLASKCLKVNNRDIAIITGYDSFPEAVKDVDIVVGPISSAVIEAGLLGIDYYIYAPLENYSGCHSIHKGIFEIANCSSSMEGLRSNIINKQPYRPGFSVFDLIDFKDVNCKSELYGKFENVISEIAEIPR